MDYPLALKIALDSIEGRIGAHFSRHARAAAAERLGTLSAETLDAGATRYLRLLKERPMRQGDLPFFLEIMASTVPDSWVAPDALPETQETLGGDEWGEL